MMMMTDRILRFPGIPVFLLLLLAGTLLADEGPVPEHPLLGEYLELNAEETRLAEYADGREMLNLKLHQLDLINGSRRRAGAGPVDLDILACRVANKTAYEACTENYTGHWNTRGEKPYHRWAFAGGMDHVVENAAARWSSAPLPDGPGALAAYMRESHTAFMNEIPPNDGHRKNCIDPVHTHVGLGLWLSGNNFRYYEEYIDRYFEFGEIPLSIAAGTEFRLPVRPRDESLNLYALIAYYESYPRPMTPAQISRKGSYPDFTGSQVLALWPWDLLPGLNKETRWSDIRLKFDRPGLYYLHMYLTKGDLPTGGGASTRGKIQASGIVIRIE